MRLAESVHLDALCGEYLLGSLRDGARRRFERALRDEPQVALRLAYWESIIHPLPSEAMSIRPSHASLPRLRRELNLDAYRLPWFERLGVLRTWAALATTSTAALALAFALNLFGGPGVQTASQTAFIQIAQLTGDGPAAQLLARRSADGRQLQLRAPRPILAGPNQSYELWLVPADAGAPISIAVLGQLDALLQLPDSLIAQVRPGAKLAVSVEPAGGSPTGVPTGTVILVGAIEV